MNGFTLAIVGRPNVGKSTFFNRLLEERKAIVEDTPGVTRDRQYGISEWNGKTFNVVDTGGFVPDSDDVFEREIRKQVVIAVEEANAIVFMCDVTTGITHLDDAMARILRPSKKPVFLVVNKVDNSERMLLATEFYGLGFENTYFLSVIKTKHINLVAHTLGKVFDLLFGHVNFTVTYVTFQRVDAFRYGSDCKNPNTVNGRDSQFTKHLLFEMLNDFFLCCWHGYDFRGCAQL